MCQDNYFMKQPCAHCPFRKDVKPFLHPERAEDIANSSQNPYNEFPCHKTTVHDEDSEDGDMMITDKSKTCYGFMALQIQENGGAPENWDWNHRDKIYEDAWDMTEAYQEEWENRNK
jgi:hypothetical protein